MKLFIGCSASNEIKEVYKEKTKEILEILLKEHDLVFGTFKEGLMGICHDIAKKNQKEIIGVCPEYCKEDFIPLSCTQKIITKSVTERTKKIIELSDAFLILPGGIGTLQELFNFIDSKRSKEWNKPIILYNINGFYDDLLVFLRKQKEENFVKEHDLKQFIVTNKAEEIIEILKK